MKYLLQLGNPGLEIGVDVLLRCSLTCVTGSEVRDRTLKRRKYKLKSVSSLFDFGAASIHEPSLGFMVSVLYFFFALSKLSNLSGKLSFHINKGCIGLLELQSAISVSAPCLPSDVRLEPSRLHNLRCRVRMDFQGIYNRKNCDRAFVLYVIGNRCSRGRSTDHRQSYSTR